MGTDVYGLDVYGPGAELMPPPISEETIATERALLMMQYINPGQEFSLREAARLVGRSTDVIQDRVTRGLMPNARRDPFNGNNRWLVSGQDLADAGLLDSFRLMPAEQARNEILEQSPQHLIIELAACEAELAARIEEVVHLRTLVDTLAGSR